MTLTKTQRMAKRRGLFRSSIEMPVKLWEDLSVALERRAARFQKTTGCETNPSFHAWLREKAQETINTYK